jgi:hypothetical protein
MTAVVSFSPFLNHLRKERVNNNLNVQITKKGIQDEKAGYVKMVSHTFGFSFYSYVRDKG